MSPHVFVIAAGGSGAKAVESLVHLCAAGLGPDKLDVLLLDVDQNNGNSKRCQALLANYLALQAGSWRARPSSRTIGSSAPDEIHFFRTRITSYCLHEPVEVVKDQGLHLHLLGEPKAKPVLDLLFDEDEQKSKCEKGFMARPNLGSLILARHLSDAFAEDGSAAYRWKEALLTAVGSADKIPVFVLGSVFGGTGASLLPVACQCLRQALGYTDTDNNWKKLLFSAVMLLPYFHPASKPNDKVDASRFLADTISTLTHYERSTALKAYQRLYLIGSDDTTRNPLQYREGASEQSNPCHLEEFIAASAILHGAGSLEIDPNNNLHAVNLGSGEQVAWSSLPEKPVRMALLAHFCTFLVAPLSPNQPLASGLLAWIRRYPDEIQLLPLIDQLIKPWAVKALDKQIDSNQSLWAQLNDESKAKQAAVQAHQSQIAEYAWRFLLWARYALPADKPDHSVTKFGHPGDYALVWEVMCSLSCDEIAPNAEGGGSDNALLRLCRAAACALEKIRTGQFDPKPSVLHGDNHRPVFPGADSLQSACLLPLDDQQLKSLGTEHSLPDKLYTDYTHTIRD